MKPLLVGESNPHQTNAEDAMRFALYPEPPHASGGRLCRIVMGLDERTYLRSFDRVDLCHPKWSLPAARARAAELVGERASTDVIVLCGVKVAEAFGGGYEPFRVYRAAFGAGPELVVLPHPSGLNRLWHQPGAVARARAVLREAGVLMCSPCPHGDDKGVSHGCQSNICPYAEDHHVHHGIGTRVFLPHSFRSVEERP